MLARACMCVCVRDSVFVFKKRTGLYNKSSGDNYVAVCSDSSSVNSSVLLDSV